MGRFRETFEDQSSTRVTSGALLAKYPLNYCPLGFGGLTSEWVIHGFIITVTDEVGGGENKRIIAKCSTRTAVKML